ncbi:hypothetical protein Godav_023451 [Gossypium davidsonii]|uniref:DUF7745 domain-containing protein n=1 Tax=Gossypium davidsonii TaxID=34287 RepID=A0A7J8STD8_GOSDV|nr:hypothetical protein [Gossypium davidsonii]
MPTVEEYTTLLCFPRIQANKAYSRVANILAFLKRLMSITEMSEQWVTTQIKQKGDNNCIPLKSLRDLILAYLDTKIRVDVFALSIYGLVIFPKALGHIDEVENVSYQVFTENYSLLKEFVATSRRYNISEEKWMAILQRLQDEDVEWRAPWMILDKILYRCGNFNWVHLLKIWGAV